MNKKQLLDEVLAVIRTIMDDKEKLEKVHTFLFDEIYEEPERIKIPEKYRKVVEETADILISGEMCFINLDTFEVEAVPEMMISNPYEFEISTGESADSIEFKYKKWKNYMTIEPLESFELFKIMEKFVDEVPDEKIRRKLIYALNKKRPFANFKNIIDYSPYREQWFGFRKRMLEIYAYDLIEMELNKNDL